MYSYEEVVGELLYYPQSVTLESSTIISEDKPVIIEFYSDNCSLCSSFDVIINSFLNNYQTVKLAKVLVDDDIYTELNYIKILPSFSLINSCLSGYAFLPTPIFEEELNESHDLIEALCSI